MNILHPKDMCKQNSGQVQIPGCIIGFNYPRFILTYFTILSSKEYMTMAHIATGEFACVISNSHVAKLTDPTILAYVDTRTAWT